jgi:phosphate acetyltransferase
MRFIGNVIEKLQRHPKAGRVSRGRGAAHFAGRAAVFRAAAGRAHRARRPAKIKEVAEAMKIPLEGIRIINPATSEDLENFSKRFHSLRREKGLRATEAREAMLQPNYYGAMMLAMHQADGLVSGASHITGSVLRPLFQIIKVAPDITRPPVAWSWKSRTRASAKTACCSWPIAA